MVNAQMIDMCIDLYLYIYIFHGLYPWIVNIMATWLAIISTLWDAPAARHWPLPTYSKLKSWQILDFNVESQTVDAPAKSDKPPAWMVETREIMGCLPPINWCRVSLAHPQYVNGKQSQKDAKSFW
jgi:hypothetical protein